MEKTLWDYDELSARLGTKKTTLYGWVHQGLIPHIRFSKKYVRFDPDTIEQWLAAKRHVEGEREGETSANNRAGARGGS